MKKKLTAICIMVAIMCSAALFAACGKAEYVLTVPETAIALKATDTAAYDFLSDVTGTKDGAKAEVKVTTSGITFGDAGVGKTYKVKYTLDDITKERDVMIYGAPVFTGGDVTIKYDGSATEELVAKDSFGKTLNITLVGGLEIDSLGRKVYKVNESVEYSATDAAGNVKTFTRKVTVDATGRPAVDNISFDLEDTRVSATLPAGKTLESVYIKSGTEYTLVEAENYTLAENNLQFKGEYIKNLVGANVFSLNFAEGYCDFTVTVADEKALAYSLENIDGYDFAATAKKKLPVLTLNDGSFQPYEVNYTLKKDGTVITVPETLTEIGEYEYTVKITRKSADTSVTMKFKVMSENDYYSRKIQGEKFVELFSRFDAGLDTNLNPIMENTVTWDADAEAFKFNSTKDSGDNDRGFYFNPLYFYNVRNIVGSSFVKMEYKSNGTMQTFATFYNSANADNAKWTPRAITTSAEWSEITLEIPYDMTEQLFFLGAGVGSFYVRNLQFVALEGEKATGEKITVTDGLCVTFDISAEGSSFWEDFSVYYNAEEDGERDAKFAPRIMLGGKRFGVANDWFGIQMMKDNEVLGGTVSNTYGLIAYGDNGTSKLSTWPYWDANWGALFPNNAGGYMIQIVNGETSAELFAFIKKGSDWVPFFSFSNVPKAASGYAGVLYRGDGKSSFEISNVNVSATLYNPALPTAYTGQHGTEAFDISFTATGAEAMDTRVYIGAASTNFQDIVSAPFAFATKGHDGNGHNAVMRPTYGNAQFYNANGDWRDNGWSAIAPSLMEIAGGKDSRTITMRFINGDSVSTMYVYADGELYMHLTDLPKFSAGYCAIVVGGKATAVSESVSGITVAACADAAVKDGAIATMTVDVGDSPIILNLHDYFNPNKALLSTAIITPAAESGITVDAADIARVGMFKLNLSEAAATGEEIDVVIKLGAATFTLKVTVTNEGDLKYKMSNDIDGYIFHTDTTITLPGVTDTIQTYVETKSMTKDGEAYTDAFTGKLPAGDYVYTVKVTGRGVDDTHIYKFSVSETAADESKSNKIRYATEYGADAESVDGVSIVFDVPAAGGHKFVDLTFFANSTSGGLIDVSHAMRVFVGGGILNESNGATAEWEAARVINSTANVDATGSIIDYKVIGNGGVPGFAGRIYTWLFDNLFKTSGGKLMGQFANVSATASEFTLFASVGTGGFRPIFTITGLDLIVPGYAGVYYKYLGTPAVAISNIALNESYYTTALDADGKCSSAYTGGSFDIEFTYSDKDVSTATFYFGAASTSPEDLLKSTMSLVVGGDGHTNFYTIVGKGDLQFTNSQDEFRDNGWAAVVGEPGIMDIGGEATSKTIKISYRSAADDKSTLTVYVDGARYLTAENMPTLTTGYVYIAAGTQLSYTGTGFTGLTFTPVV